MGYNKPRSANDTTPLPAITMWSSTRASTRANAERKRLRQELVGPAGLGDAGRMVVRQDHSRGVVRQRALDDFTRVHAGLREVPRNISFGKR
jgi:hypothetical protein